jgi:pimeloyl-ACP methyl ester carboxylesterase
VRASNTTENAADFADLRTALGIPTWNVYGWSYGTDLALSYLRDHPAGIRSVGSPSPEATACAWSIARSFFNVLNQVDSSCTKRVQPTRWVLTKR